MRYLLAVLMLVHGPLAADDAATQVKPVKVGNLPAEVLESSGLARGPKPGTFLTHGDSISPRSVPAFFVIRESGEVLERIELSAIKQRDWEAITVDNDGRIYVCDVGNNLNDRRDLTIYRLDPKRPALSGQIVFDYADQREFPPPMTQMNFDVEACVWHEKHLYLFTKDRGASGTSKVYCLKTAGPVRQTAELLGQIELDGQVTDAALSPKHDRLVLLGREKLFVASIENSEFVRAKYEKRPLPGIGKSEGVTFIDDSHLLISNEEGELYRYDLD
jgi:hypothetical protein